MTEVFAMIVVLWLSIGAWLTIGAFPQVWRRIRQEPKVHWFALAFALGCSLVASPILFLSRLVGQK